MNVSVKDRKIKGSIRFLSETVGDKNKNQRQNDVGNLIIFFAFCL